MGIIEAVQHLKNGGKVRREDWGNSIEMGKVGYIAWSDSVTPIAFKAEDFEAQDWVVVS